MHLMSALGGEDIQWENLQYIDQYLKHEDFDV